MASELRAICFKGDSDASHFQTSWAAVPPPWTFAVPTSHGRNSEFYTETPVPGSDSADGLESLF